MFADAWFTIGETHTVCEDFAMAGAGEGRAWAVVTDGCSSSPHTDIGARLLALSARQELLAGRHPGPETVRRAAESQRALSIDPRCLDATLLVASCGPDGCRVSVYGDGVVLARTRGGETQVFEFEHPDGAPPYLSYELSAERARRWRQCCGHALIERALHEPQRALRLHATAPHLSFSATEYSVVGLASDGMSSIVQSLDDGGSPVPVVEVARRMFAFPQYRGRFVARRGRRFIRRECPRLGWRPRDDMAFAVVTLTDPSGPDLAASDTAPPAPVALARTVEETE